MSSILALKLKGRVLTPSNGEEYEKAIKRNSPLSVLPAKYIVYPDEYSDISAVLAFANSHKPPLEIAVKGGGAHSSTWSSSDGGIVVDLSKLRSVSISEDKRSVVVQGGAVWGDVYEECKKAAVDVVGGPLWFVGVGGFLLGGGYGPLSGEHGLAVDNLLSATVVLADGRLVKASSTQESDLFWAIRGGGGQFGVLAEVELKAFPQVGPITSGIFVYPGSDVGNILKVVKAWKETYTGKEKLNMTFNCPAPHFKPAVVIMPWVSEDPDFVRSKAVLAPFRDGAVKPLLERVYSVPDMLAVSHGADAAFAVAPKRLTIRGALFSDYYDEMIMEVWDRYVKFTEGNEDAKGCAILWDLTRAEKVCEVGNTDTAVCIREPNYWVAIQGRTNNPAADVAIGNFVASTVDFIRSKNAELSGKDYGLFLSMAQGDENPEDVFGSNLTRLRQLKAKYDPNNLFKKGVAIPHD